VTNAAKREAIRAERDQLRRQVVQLEREFYSGEFAETWRRIFAKRWLAWLIEKMESVSQGTSRPVCAVCLTHQPARFGHARVCDAARFLRELGGPEETQRQVDAAHVGAIAGHLWTWRRGA